MAARVVRGAGVAPPVGSLWGTRRCPPRRGGGGRATNGRDRGWARARSLFRRRKCRRPRLRVRNAPGIIGCRSRRWERCEFAAQEFAGLDRRGLWRESLAELELRVLERTTGVKSR